MIITSTSNDKIKLIRKLRDRKTRQETGEFYIEGLRITGEAMEQGAAIHELIYCPELLVSDFGRKLVEQAGLRNLETIEVSADVFRSIALKDGPQGIAATVRQKWELLDSIEPAAGSIWVVLDSPQDPGNVGTILRTLDSVGGDGVILMDAATDPYDPTSIRASMGSIFDLKLVRCDFDEFAAWKRNLNLILVGTSGQAELDYHFTEYPNPCILLMGSERQGLLEKHFSLCDQVVRIPMAGKSDSLNLAVSTGIILYEIFNQKRKLSAGT